MLVAVVSTSSCKKPVFYSAENLSFSADTVVFDTVFTTVGSTTKQFKIYNNDKRTITIQEIELAGGSASPYRINVDGVSGTNFSNIDLEGNDSLFVFVEVTLDPNNGTTPFLVEDSIRFRTNGVDQYVYLAACGQDAYFHFTVFSQNIIDSSSGIWPNDKPHVIYGAAIVHPGESLTIQQGTDIYLHDGSYLYVYQGQIDIQGTATEPVTFQGDRLEAYYDDVSGQYYGIYMQEALPSTINYAEIKNGISGIHLYSEDPGNTDYTLKVSNTIIENCASYGIFIYSGAKVQAQNCLIARNGIHSLLVLEGGDFNFNNCHLVGYGNSGASGASVGITNHYIRQDNIQYVGSINEGTITNSVIYGNLEHELVLDTIPDVAITLNFIFENNLIKSDDVFTDGFFANNLWNLNPNFIDVSVGDFQYIQGSALSNQGTNSFSNTIPAAFSLDLLGNFRPIGVRDIGAYELW